MSRLLFDRLNLQLKGSPYERILAGAMVIQNYDALESVWFQDASIDELPSFAPIYPKVFVETHMPFMFSKEIYGGVIIEATESKDGELPISISPLRLAEDRSPRWVLNAMSFIDPKWNRTITEFARSITVLDAQGKPIALALETEPDSLGFSATWLNPTVAQLIDEVYDRFPGLLMPGVMDQFAEKLLDAALFTIGLLHVKNVQAVDVEPNHKEAKKFKKHYGLEMTRYKVLKITGKGGSAGTVIGERGSGSSKALHWCRGHFRTYDDAAPLFGKLTGTFFVEPHMRGSRSRGEVVKDYEVGNHV